jgi:hypothetical protein
MTQPIRDIREDLKARLGLIPTRRQEAKVRYDGELAEIKREEEALEALLASEERLMAASQIPSERSWAGNALENAILDLLSDELSWDHPDVKSALQARGHVKGDPGHFGQMLHGVLLSMSRRGLLDSLGVGRWKITKYGLTGEQE